MKKIILCLFVWAFLLILPGTVKNSFADCAGISTNVSTVAPGGTIAVVVSGCSDSSYQIKVFGALSPQFYGPFPLTKLSNGDYAGNASFPSNTPDGNYSIVVADATGKNLLQTTTVMVTSNSQPNPGNGGVVTNPNPSNCTAGDFGCMFGSPFGGTASTTGSTLGDLVALIVRIGFVVSGVLILFFILFAGFSIIQGAGSNNPEAAKKGQQAATAAAIGFVIVFGAYWIVRLIEVIINVHIISP